MFMPGLDSERFGNQSWIHDGSASPFEFKIANTYAGCFRIDNYSVPGLRLSLSGYVGNSFRNTLYPTSSSSNDKVHGTVSIGTFDFAYNAHNFIARGYFDYGHLSDAKHISSFNIRMPKILLQNVRKWPRTPCAPVLKPVTIFLPLFQTSQHETEVLHIRKI